MHLGSGASVCGIKDGKSIDTSMGLTPLDGLPGATRSGSVDASLIFHYTNSAGRLSRRAAEAVEITDAEEILNVESGWKSLTGTTNFAVIADRAGKEEHPNETLAFDIYSTVESLGDCADAWHALRDVLTTKDRYPALSTIAVELEEIMTYGPRTANGYDVEERAQKARELFTMFDGSGFLVKVFTLTSMVSKMLMQNDQRWWSPSGVDCPLKLHCSLILSCHYLHVYV